MLATIIVPASIDVKEQCRYFWLKYGLAEGMTLVSIFFLDTEFHTLLLSWNVSRTDFVMIPVKACKVLELVRSHRKTDDFA